MYLQNPFMYFSSQIDIELNYIFFSLQFKVDVFGYSSYSFGITTIPISFLDQKLDYQRQMWELQR